MESMGPIVDGRYAITHRIHVSRSATIFLAHDQFLRRSVVLKALHPPLAADPAYVERFRREACIAATLSHPNLISVYNFGSSGGTYYIVMEHVTGPSLGEHLRIGGRLAEARALEITSHVAAALAAAHERGVVHRDICSHTILLAAGGQVKVTDFGCAQTTGVCAPDLAEATQSATNTLTMSVNAGADLHDLGLVLCEMLTGIQASATNGIAPSAWANLHLSPSTDAIVRRALAPHATLRFPTAEALRAAVDDARSQIATGASPSGWPPVAPIRAAERYPRIGFRDLFRPRSTRLAS